MSLVATQGVWMPYPPQIVLAPANVSLLIDATGEKVAIIGRVWNKDHTTKNITKVGFRFGVVTKAGGSALTVSLQDVNLAAGGPYQPDETQDQTVAIANADAGFVSNSWYQTNALSAVRSVAFGEHLAVVVEYDGAGRLAADAVNLTGLQVAASNRFLTSGMALKTAGWAVSTAQSNVILEFDDGTFGTLSESLPYSTFAVLAYNSGSAADEVALEFTVPFSCKVDGAYVIMATAFAASDFDVVLYDGTTVLATASSDGNTAEATGTNRVHVVTFAEQTLVPGTVYRLSLKPTTTNGVSLHYFEVAAANHMQALPGGTSWVYTTRVDAGAWAAPTTTRRPWAGLRISALDNGVVPRQPRATFGLGI